jgi:replicative DNA helicase
MHDDGGQVGFGRGWFLTLAGLTGHGKSITALNFCLAALRAGETVCYCSLEMSAQQIAARFYAMAGRVPVIGLERGSFDERIWSEAQKGLALPSLLMPDEISGRWEDQVSFIRQAVEEKGATYVILDYLQLCSVGDESDIMRGISEITTDLRSYAANNGIVCLVLSQFNRTTSAEFRTRPRMTGLWGGAIIEQSSDVVMLLAHHAFERDDANQCSRTFIQVEKNRHGMVGDIPIFNSYRDLSQRQAMPDELDEWPEP